MPSWLGTPVTALLRISGKADTHDENEMLMSIYVVMYFGSWIGQDIWKTKTLNEKNERYSG
jgi:hypothetical protein